MNKKNNERYADTERRIIEAFAALLSEKEMEKITVSEICRMTGIHRTSFYLHFQDVYDLMDKLDLYLSAQYLDIFTENSDENYDLSERFGIMFSFIAKNMNFYKAYIPLGTELKFFDAVLSKEAKANKEQIIERYGFTDDEELEYHTHFFTAGITAMIYRWLMRGCPETPERLAEILKNEYTGRT